MAIGRSSFSPGNQNIPWDEKVSRWKNYEDRMTDLIDNTKSLSPEDKAVISDYRAKIHKGIAIRKTCRLLEKGGLIAAQIAATAIIPILLVGSAPLAIATAGTLMAGMGTLIGSQQWARRHPDQFVSGTPDQKTMQALFRAFNLKKKQDVQEAESSKRIGQKVNEFREVIDKTQNMKDYLPGIDIVEGEVIISGLRLPRKKD